MRLKAAATIRSTETCCRAANSAIWRYSALVSTRSPAPSALQSPHMVTGIEHVAIASPDPLRLARWYVDHLDFVINYQPAHSRTVFIKAADGSMIEIIESAPDTVPAAGMNSAGLRHLALTVADFPGVYTRLKEKGVRFLTDAQTTNGNSLAFFTDPDGNLLHLLHRESPLP